MASPSTRDELIQWCLNKLGAPVVEIDVDPVQLSDRVDEALQYFADYEFDGVEKLYVKHQMTPTDITNGYVTLPNSILGVTNIWPVSNVIGGTSGNLFDFAFQFAVSSLWQLHSMNLSYFVTGRQYLSLIQQTLVGQPMFRFNRIQHKVFLDVTLGATVKENDWIIMEAYGQIDPATYPNIWNDRLLKNLCTSLFKEQWATNIKKFGNISVLGGVTLDGNALYQEAQKELSEVKNEILDSGACLEFFVG